MAKITINGISFDPDQEVVRVAGLDSSDTSASNYVIIQSNAPLTKEQKNEINGLGAQILEYYPENAYLCKFPPSSLDAIKALPYVVFAGVYPQEIKISLPLRLPSLGNTAELLSLGPVETSMSQQPYEVDVVLHNDVTGNSVRENIARAARLDPQDLSFSQKKVRLIARPQDLEDITAIDEVKAIQPVEEYRLCNSVAVGIIRADQTHRDLGLKGEGQIIAICDTGFDKGSTTDVHPAFQGRVLKLYDLGRPGKSNDPNGHGTHVAGSVLGDGSSIAMGGVISGTAPAANLVFQSVLDSRGGLGGLPQDLNDLFIVPYRDDKARVHTNSWGVPVQGRYVQDSREVDEFVFNHRDCVICFAAGNDGRDSDANGTIDFGSLYSPGTAKNCITVGASENYRPEISAAYGERWHSAYPVDPIASALWAGNAEGIAAFSGRGPAQQNRIKPDVVAPGSSILSAHSREARVGDFWGKSSDPLFCFMGGTSMATPLVAGCAAIVRQYLTREHSHSNPSAALVKAMLINGAVEMAGKYSPSEAGVVPSFSQGFGRVNLPATIGPFSPNVTLKFRDEGNELDTGEEEKITLNLTSIKPLLKVTLVWTDQPGEALQSDLDLIVRAGAQERHGNMPPDSVDFDRNNNVEQVIWYEVPTSSVEIITRSHRALQPQTYALVIRIENE